LLQILVVFVVFVVVYTLTKRSTHILVQIPRTSIIFVVHALKVLHHRHGYNY